MTKRKRKSNRLAGRKLRRLSVEERNSTYRGRACLYDNGLRVGVMEKFNEDDTVEVVRKGVTSFVSINDVTFY